MFMSTSSGFILSGIYVGLAGCMSEGGGEGVGEGVGEGGGMEIEGDGGDEATEERDQEDGAEPDAEGEGGDRKRENKKQRR